MKNMESDRNRRGRQRGLTVAELLIVVALMGLSVLLTAGAWQGYRRATALSSAAQLFQRSIAQARLRAIYSNVNHFVVLDTAGHSVSIVEDSGANVGIFEDDDRVMHRQPIAENVKLELPTATMPHPLGSGNITKAWTLPAPASGGAWGKAVGLLCNPEGRLVDVSATPGVIGFGAAVLNDSHAHRTVGIGLEGQSGTVRAYRYEDGSWKQM